MNFFNCKTFSFCDFFNITYKEVFLVMYLWSTVPYKKLLKIDFNTALLSKNVWGDSISENSNKKTKWVESYVSGKIYEN